MTFQNFYLRFFTILLYNIYNKKVDLIMLFILQSFGGEALWLRLC